MFHELHASRRGRLLAFATTLAGPSAAEDLVQDAVVATFSRHRGFTSVEQAEHYVRRAIASRYVDSIRKSISVRTSERGASLAEAVPDGTDVVANHDVVTHALATLPPRVRACVALRYLEDLSIRETAVTLGLSEGAVKRYVSDGIAQLNAALGTSGSLTDDERVALAHTKGSSR